LKKINPLELLLWTFRRNEKDVVNLYSSLSDVMRLATGGDMLNFGYWDETTPTPASAQQKLCSKFGHLAKLSPGQRVLDVGSGYGAPATRWESEYDPIDIFSININFEQLSDSSPGSSRVNATATVFPFEASSVDRVLAFESAQHFKPLKSFLSESFRVLKNGGYLALAIPVMTENASPLKKLGLLSMTWSSEHYSEEFVMSEIRDAGFEIDSEEKIGPMVYDPLADYYEHNRPSIQKNILGSYPDYVEKILYRSIRKMRDVSEKNVIEYLLILCRR